MERVKKGEKFIADEHPEVTVLFCDIYGFDDICAEHTPKELIELLNEVQLTFDQLCQTYGIDKIETVGKTYMACGGLDYNTNQNQMKLNHACRTLLLALDMFESVKHIILKNGKTLQIKIGINSGSVIAGVVGSHKPQFALVGDTVNTASRMCSNVKVPMNVRISDNTYQLVSFMRHMKFQEETIEAKGKGSLTTYIVKFNKGLLN